MAPIAALVASALGASNLAARGFSYHDNTVTIYNSHLLGGSFTVSAFAVSPGQDPQNKNHVGDVHVVNAIPVGDNNEVDGDVVFTAGRHQTSDVAQWWSASAPPAQNTFGHNAGGLNFAFIGTLVLNLEYETATRVTFTNVGFAQGSDSNGNNWWFGGQPCTHTGNNLVDCAGIDQNGQQVVATFERGGSDTSINEVAMSTVRYV